MHFFVFQTISHSNGVVECTKYDSILTIFPNEFGHLGVEIGHSIYLFIFNLFPLHLNIDSLMHIHY